MINNIAKCGCDCFNCPTSKGNIGTIEERKKCSAGWEKFLDIKLSPEKLRACDGCSIPDSERKTYYLNCKIRKCAMINQIENCAYCIGFPCDELLKVHSIQRISTREEFINKTGKEISETDYNYFIEPYTGLCHLNKVRQNLAEKDYKDYKKFSTKTKFAPLVNFNIEQESLGIIYSLLTTICVEQNISFARLQTLESKREQLLKILWTMGNYGIYKKDCSYIELDSKTFLFQKIHSMYNTLLEYFNDLKNADIYCEIIPLVEKGWLTPLGGLRKEGWIIRLSFGESLKGNETLRKFKDYILNLNNRYGNKAYRLFKRADLSMMN